MRNKWIKTVVKVSEEFLINSIKGEIGAEEMRQLWEDSNHNTAVRDAELCKLVKENITDSLKLCAKSTTHDNDRFGIPAPTTWEADGWTWEQVPDIVIEMLYDQEVAHEHQMDINRLFS